jgi:hypothetical protein
MFKTLKKKFSKNVSLGNKKSSSPREGDEQKRDGETSSSRALGSDDADSFSASGRKSGPALSLSDKLKSISIKDKSIARSSGTKSKKVISGPGAIGSARSSTPPKKQESFVPPPNQPSLVASTTPSFDPIHSPAAAASELKPRGGNTNNTLFDSNPGWESFTSEVTPAAAADQTSSDHVMEEKKRQGEDERTTTAASAPPPFVSPIEEARRKWQQAHSNTAAEDHLDAEQEVVTMPSLAVSSPRESNTSSGEDGFLYTSSVDAAGAFDETLTGQRAVSSRNFSQGLLSSLPQRLCQVVHDFTADSEDELTVYTGDVVEVEREEDGWYLARVFNEDGSFEEGLIPASYCIEWNEEDSSSAVASGPLSPRISPRPSLSRTSLNRAATFDGSTFNYIQPPIASIAYLELCEVVNAKFSGNTLEKYGVHGTVKTSDTYTEKDSGDLLEFDIVPSSNAHPEGAAEDEGFAKAKFYLNNSLRAGSKFIKEENRVSVELDNLPESFAESKNPLLQYSLEKDLYPVPLVVQVSWCRREGKGAFVACVSLTLSPLLTAPLENVSVTLAGLPPVKKTDQQVGVGFRCSPACELCSNDLASTAVVRWPDLGNVSDAMQLRVIMEEEDEGEGKGEGKEERGPLVLEASVEFHSQGSISGFGLRECGLYNSNFKSGTYFATSKYTLQSLEQTVPTVVENKKTSL